MLRKLAHLFKFFIKYEIKRNMTFFLVFGVIYLFLLFVPAGKGIRGAVKSVNIIDNDNTNLSSELSDFLVKDRGFVMNNASFSTLRIPKDFEKDYNASNATLFIGLFGVGDTDIYEFQISHMKEKKRIRSKMDKPNDVKDYIILLMFMLLIFPRIIAKCFVDRISGTIHFISNYMNYWAYLICSDLLIVVMVVLFILNGLITVDSAILLMIVFLVELLIMYHRRRNPNSVGHIEYLAYGLVFLLFILRTTQMKELPIVDLLFPGFQMVMMIDIAILCMLVYFTSKIRITEM